MPNKAIFLDRDDTLIEDPGYINNPDQVKLLEGVPAALIAIKAMGYKLVVVSNQSGVARGIVTEEVLAKIHKRLEHLLAREGASLDRIYYCPYHPEGAIPKYRRDSEHRKPNPGMLLDAAKDMDIDLAQSWMVGNGPGDIEAGARAGCRTIMLDSPRHEQKIRPGERAPDYRAVNLKEVVNIIKMHVRTTQKPAIAAPPVQPTPINTQEPQRQPESQQQDETSQQDESEQALSFQQAESEQTPVQPFGGDLITEPQTEEQPEDSESSPQTTEQLLRSILDQLKMMHRSQMFGVSEFSFPRFIAGMLQVGVGVCLLMSIWFLLSPDKQTDRLLITLGFAAVLQLTALTLYTMQGPK